MQILYVTDLAIEPTDEVDDQAALAATLGILSAWAGDEGNPIRAADLLEDGHQPLQPTHASVSKFAEWTHLESPERGWVTRLDIVNVSADGSRFTARVSVGQLDGALRLRLGLARDMAATGLSPIADPEVRQPHVLADLVRHPSLRVSSGGQIVDGELLRARGAEAAALVADVLRVQQRLPVLLVHARTIEAHKAAQRAAAGLIGLARVVTVDLPTARHLVALEPRARVPYAGGLLVWSDLAVPATAVGEEVVNTSDIDTLRGTVMRQVAPLSALTRGADELYRAVREAGRASRADVAAARTAAALQSGSREALVDALTQERDQLRSDLNDALDGWQESENRAEALAKEAARWKATAEQLQIAQQYAGAPLIDEESEQDFNDAPTLIAGDVDSLDAVIAHLENCCEGRIAFTLSARTSWKKADHYPTPDQMRTALIKLATVARDLYDGSDRTIGHLDRWVRETYDLKISLQDDQMPRAFRNFTLDGEKYDRTPHVKVNDGVPPHECGRIYFALDKKNERIIVDHVGVHY